MIENNQLFSVLKFSKNNWIFGLFNVKNEDQYKHRILYKMDYHLLLGGLSKDTGI